MELKESIGKRIEVVHYCTPNNLKQSGVIEDVIYVGKYSMKILNKYYSKEKRNKLKDKINPVPCVCFFDEITKQPMVLRIYYTNGQYNYKIYNDGNDKGIFTENFDEEFKNAKRLYYKKKDQDNEN